jgi:hypothetical protein
MAISKLVSGLAITLLVMVSVSQQQQNKFFARIDAERWDDFFRSSISKINKWRKTNEIPQLKFNPTLISLAQKEAQRLASLGKLEKPSIFSSSKVYGQSSQFVGYIKTTDENLGQKICYDTQGDKTYDETYALLARCLPYDVVFTEYGYGKAYDTNQILYTVDLFAKPGSLSGNDQSKKPQSTQSTGDDKSGQRKLLIQLLELLNSKLGEKDVF